MLSSNFFVSPEYDVTYATASSVKGAFTKSSAPLFLTIDPFAVTATRRVHSDCRWREIGVGLPLREMHGPNSHHNFRISNSIRLSFGLAAKLHRVLRLCDEVVQILKKRFPLIDFPSQQPAYIMLFIPIGRALSLLQMY